MNDFWRSYINGLDIENDLDDDIAPTLTAQEEVLEKEATVMRLKFDIYLINPIDDPNKAYMVNSNQKLEDMGPMKIREALSEIKRRNRGK